MKALKQISVCIFCVVGVGLCSYFGHIMDDWALVPLALAGMMIIFAAICITVSIWSDDANGV
jgi:type IV secretory pathway VirB2 component (pilin)